MVIKDTSPANKCKHDSHPKYRSRSAEFVIIDADTGKHTYTCGTHLLGYVRAEALSEATILVDRAVAKWSLTEGCD
jgi:hypothetical protein